MAALGTPEFVHDLRRTGGIANAVLAELCRAAHETGRLLADALLPRRTAFGEGRCGIARVDVGDDVENHGVGGGELAARVVGVRTIVPHLGVVLVETALAPAGDLGDGLRNATRVEGRTLRFGLGVATEDGRDVLPDALLFRGVAGPSLRLRRPQYIVAGRSKP